MSEALLKRLSRSKEISQIVVATSDDARNLPLVDFVPALGYACVQGSENNVLERFVQAGRQHGADVIVRFTGDCPLVDPQLVDACVRGVVESGVDYYINTFPPSFPDGLDVE